MTAATVREPTKKAFHFPKSPEEAAQEPVEAAEPAVEAAEPAAAAEKPKAKRTKATTKKAASKAAKKAASPAKQAPAREAAGKGKVKRAKKEKVVRDSFTMPKADYDRIAVLKRKCLDAGVAVKKSELLRAGLQLLESSSEKRLMAAIAALEEVKTGRPSKSE
jgi:hypothetical protein